MKVTVRLQDGENVVVEDVRTTSITSGFLYLDTPDGQFVFAPGWVFVVEKQEPAN